MGTRLVALALFAAAFVLQATAAEEIISGNSTTNEIVRINPVTGGSTTIAVGGLDTIYSYDQIVYDSTSNSIFQVGMKNGLKTLETIILSTGAKSFATLNLSSEVLGGVYGSALIAAVNNTIYSVNPSTGAATAIATGTLDTVYSYDKIIVDSIGGYVYQYGVKNGVNSIQKINLTNGAVTTLSTTLTGSPSFGGFYNQALIVALNNQIQSVNLANGSSTVIATGILDTVYSGDKFIVSSESGYAYQYGLKNNVTVLEKINLQNGTSTVTSYSPANPPTFAAVVTVPEPSTLTMAALAALAGIGTSLRARASRQRS